MSMATVRADPSRAAMDSRQPITVAIARFDDLVALGLRALLAGQPTVTVIADDISRERLSVVLRTHRPQVLILDVGMLEHLVEVRELSERHRQTRLVLLGDRLTSIETAQLLAFGASACLSMDTQGRDVLNAIHLASRGLQLTPLGPPDDHGVQIRDSLLTPREGDVLLLLRQGLSNAEIALALQIGVETVRSHARSVYRKLGVRSRRALITLATAAAPRATQDDAGRQRRRSSAGRTRAPHD
jgi:DNA-binding NarL/FixJ family response regulator